MGDGAGTGWAVRRTCRPQTVIQHLVVLLQPFLTLLDGAAELAILSHCISLHLPSTSFPNPPRVHHAQPSQSAPSSNIPQVEVCKLNLTLASSHLHYLLTTSSSRIVLTTTVNNVSTLFCRLSICHCICRYGRWLIC